MDPSVEGGEDPVRVAAVVKLGGAAVTWKGEFETLDEHALKKCALAIGEGVRVEKELMSRKRKRKEPAGRPKGFVVVHGAGSFGHFQARQYGVSKGVPPRDTSAASCSSGLDTAPTLMSESSTLLRGVAYTRQSVTTLNQKVVAALLAEGVPAVGMSPFGGWRTNSGAVTDAADAVRSVRAAVAAGLVPVLHGDVVLDDLRGCAILSGDTITHELAAAMRPDRVVFLTDVAGVFTRPPEVDKHAVLLRRIVVGNTEDATNSTDWHVEEVRLTKQSSETFVDSRGCARERIRSRDNVNDWHPVQSNERRSLKIGGLAWTFSDEAAAALAAFAGVVGTTGADVTLGTAANDVTGGMAAKVNEAGAAARLGIDVYIAAAGTEDGKRAVVGYELLCDNSHSDLLSARGWLGTHLRKAA